MLHFIKKKDNSYMPMHCSNVHTLFYFRYYFNSQFINKKMVYKKLFISLHLYLFNLNHELFKELMSILIIIRRFI